MLDHGVALDPEQIVLTTSTSEAYSFLFRLLCDPGDEIVTLQPGYPLFDFLAALDDVQLKSAPLVYDHGWQIDFGGDCAKRFHRGREPLWWCIRTIRLDILRRSGRRRSWRRSAGSSIFRSLWTRCFWTMESANEGTREQGGRRSLVLPRGWRECRFSWSAG